MSLFEFKGRNTEGKMIQGQVDASTSDAAANQLLGRGITPIALTPFVEKLTLAEKFERATDFGTVSTTELIMFFRQLHTISRAGIPLVKGLRGLAASLRNYKLQHTLNDLVERLEMGSELSSAMRQHPTLFNNMIVNLVSVGENTGKLDIIFKQLAQYMERDHSTVRSIKTALRYPSMVMIVMAVALAIVNYKVIPAFSNMFEKFGAELPIYTRILIAISDFFVNFWWLVILILGIGISWFYHYVNSEAGSRVWGKTKLTMPIIGPIIERATLARYSRTFSLMLSAGLPLSTALELCARAIDNPYLGDKIRQIRAGVERGEGLYQTHLVSGMFTPLILQMIAVGEESGQVDVLLTEVAIFYEDEVDYDVKKLSDKIEPIIIVMMAFFVTVLALGIFLPMWEMFNIQK